MSTKKEETHLRLLDTARKLLIERGFHGVGLDDIATEAGVSRQAVYKSHFSSKTALLLALVRHVHQAERLPELTRPAIAAKTALEALEESIRAFVLIERRVHELSLLLQAASLSDAGAETVWRDRLEVKRNFLGSAVVRLAEERRLSPKWTVHEATDLLCALLCVDSYQQLVVERGWSQDSFIRRVYELCAATLLVEPPEGRKPRRPRKPPRAV